MPDLNPSSKDTESVQRRLSLKDKAGNVTNRWMERNKSLVLRQTPVWAQTLASIVISLGGLALVGGFLFRIDEVVTVSGQLKSIGGRVDVETPAGGLVDQVYFDAGQFVKKDQLLVRFDTRQAREQKKTLQALIFIEKNNFTSQSKLFDSQENTLRSRRSVIIQRLNTKRKITDEMSKLVQQGGFQRLQYLEQLDQIFELEQQLSDIAEQISRLNLQREQANLRHQKSLDQMNNKLTLAELQLQYQNVKAPVSGIIFDPQASSQGVTQPGERILSIIPQKGLYAEVFVPNQDIGFVKIGQSAKIRVDAFPFTRYGELSGSVSYIAADALEPNATMSYYRFPVRLNLQKSYLESNGSKIPLKTGMSITTNLKLRDKRVISLLSDLLVDQTDSVRSIRQQ